MKGKWSFSFKIFRNNIYSIPPDVEDLVSPENKYLYTLAPSYLGESTITLLNKRSTGVFTSTIKGESTTNIENNLDIPHDHLHFGATTGLNDPFDYFISQKLQSLWTQRQLIKGDGGQIYELENGNLTIRTSNVFLHGNFRGLLIEIEVNEVDDGLLNVFDGVREKYAIPEGVLVRSVLDTRNLDRYGDLCLQYLEVLNF